MRRNDWALWEKTLAALLLCTASGPANLYAIERLAGRIEKYQNHGAWWNTWEGLYTFVNFFALLAVMFLCLTVLKLRWYLLLLAVPCVIWNLFFGASVLD